MRDFFDLPRVSCKLKFSDALVDIASFRAGAKTAGWTSTEITVAIMKASELSRELDDIGVVLCQYCVDKSWVARSEAALK